MSLGSSFVLLALVLLALAGRAAESMDLRAGHIRERRSGEAAGAPRANPTATSPSLPPSNPITSSSTSTSTSTSTSPSSMSSSVKPKAASSTATTSRSVKPSATTTVAIKEPVVLNSTTVSGELKYGEYFYFKKQFEYGENATFNLQAPSGSLVAYFSYTSPNPGPGNYDFKYTVDDTNPDGIKIDIPEPSSGNRRHRRALWDIFGGIASLVEIGISIYKLASASPRLVASSTTIFASLFLTSAVFIHKRLL